MTENGKPSIEGVIRSLNGFDEIAIVRMFGKDMDGLSGTMLTRALVFILKRRDGSDDAEAFKAAMNMPLGDIDNHFDITGVETAGEA